jgi:hypothetical protein
MPVKKEKGAPERAHNTSITQEANQLRCPTWERGVDGVPETPVVETVLTCLGLQACASGCFAAANSGQSMSVIG